MQYLLMIYTEEAQDSRRSEAEGQAMMADYMAYTKSIIDSGHRLGGERLRPTAEAKTVRVRDGKAVTTDGPFAETREQLGGFYMVEAKDVEEACGLAARIPGARHGSIEVRAIWPVPRP